jgi:hypothetical protein
MCLLLSKFPIFFSTIFHAHAAKKHYIQLNSVHLGPTNVKFYIMECLKVMIKPRRRILTAISSK